MTATTSQVAARLAFSRLARPRIAEIVFWVIVAVTLFVLPDQALLLNEVVIFGLFAVSLDFVLGYAGIVSLGHAAFFGVGAYTAGILAKAGFSDPFMGLLAAGAVAGAVGFATSFLVLRGTDLTRIMVTLSVSLVLYELANRLSWLTGGADGLQGITMGPILGLFDFDIFGRIGYAYSLAVTFVLTMVARRILNSPFGWSVRAARENPLRTASIGIPVNTRLVTIYSIGAVYAGIAGGLLAQTTQFVSLDVLAFHRSADTLLMLVIGGVGYLYGGLIGALAFKLIQDNLSAITPQFWEFWVGLLLVVFVLVGRDRLFGWPRLILRRIRA